MDGKRKRSMKSVLHLADGIAEVPQRPVSPFSVKGIARGLSGGYESLVGATTDLMERVRPIRSPIPTVEAAPVPAQTAAGAAPPMQTAPITQGAPTIGGAINTMQQRRALLNELADGGFPHIVPGRRNGNKDTVPAMLTPEEAVLPVDTVDALGGREAVQELIDRTHTPVRKTNMREGFVGYANGTSDVEDPRFPKGEQGPSVSTQIAPAPIDQTLPVPPGGEVVVPRRQPATPIFGKGAGGDLRMAGEFMPGTRAVLRGAGEDIADEWGRGDVAGVVGKAFRGAVALPVGLASDAIMPSVRGAQQLMTGGEGPGPIRRFAEAFADRPLPSIIPSANASPAPTSLRVPVLTDAQRGGADRTPVPVPRQTSFGNVAGDTAFDNRGPVSAQNLAAADALEARGRAERAVSLREGMPEAQPTVTGIRGDGVGLLSESHLKERERQMAIDAATQGMSPVDRAQFIAQMEQTQAQRDTAAMRDATERRGQDITDAGFERRDRVTLRGQDITARGQDMTARSAAAKARADQFNSDRQYQLDVAKFGESQAKERFDQRTAATREVSERVKSMVPAGPDGKADATAQARAMESMNAMIADRQAKLQAELQKNPGNKAAVAELDAIERMGPGVFTDAQIRQLVVGSRARDVANAQSGVFNLGSNNGQRSSPVTSLRRDPGFFYDDYVTDTGDRIPSWKIDGMPVFGNRNADFDYLKR